MSTRDHSLCAQRQTRVGGSPDPMRQDRWIPAFAGLTLPMVHSVAISSSTKNEVALPPTLRGASSLLVIAVLVLLGGLSVYVVGLVSSVSHGQAMETQLARAEQAALSGLEWGRYRMMQNAAPCIPSQNVALPGSLAAFRVTLLCIQGGAEQTAPPSTVQYRLTATACNVPLGGLCPNPSANPGPDYVERSVSALVDR